MNDSNKIFAPNYTQCPNVFFDYWLTKLGLAELKVFLLIMRKTLGWHKFKDRISMSQLELLTGLTAPSIRTATDSLIEYGLITKEVIGENGNQETYYEILIIEENSNNSYPRSCLPPPSNLGGTPKVTPRGATIPTKERVIKEKSKQQQEATQDCQSKPTTSKKVVVVESLHKLEINDNLKEKISASNPISSIDIAVERVLAWTGRASDEAAIIYCLKHKDDWIDRPPQKPSLPYDQRNSQYVKTHFISGKSYQGAECSIDSEGIGFHRGMTQMQLRFKDAGFIDQFQNMLRKFNIAIPGEK